LIKGIDKQDKDGIYDRELTGVFGVGAAEGRTAGVNIRAANADSDNKHPKPVSHLPSAAIVTSPEPDSRTRGMTVHEDQVPAAKSGELYGDLAKTDDPVKKAANSHPAVALEMQSQTTLNSRNLGREVGKVGIGLEDQFVTSEVYQQVVNTGRTLSDPDPELTPEKRKARVAEHDRAVDTGADRAAGLSRRKYRKPENQALLDKTKEIVHAIIEAMGAKELEGTWATLRELFLQIEKENGPQKP
jgi:predicted component of type VI protein secretion system